MREISVGTQQCAEGEEEAASLLDSVGGEHESARRRQSAARGSGATSIDDAEGPVFVDTRKSNRESRRERATSRSSNSHVVTIPQRVVTDVVFVPRRGGVARGCGLMVKEAGPGIKNASRGYEPTDLGKEKLKVYWC